MIPLRYRRVLAGLGIVLAVLVTVWAFLRSGVPSAPAIQQSQPGMIDRFVWSYQEVVRREPENLDAHALLGWAYIQKARETGDPAYYARAEAVLDAALRRDERHVESLIGAGTLALARHQFRDALALGERARAIDPYVPRVYGVIADAQIELGMYDAAVTTIQTMVDMRPDLGSYSRASYARELYGDLDGAIEAMDMAVRAGGPTTENTEWARVQLGHLYAAKGDLINAERTYRLSLERLPGYAHALAGLARISAAQGRFDEAIELYGQAVARMPLPEFVIGLGETYEAAGRPEDAARQYDLVRAMQQLNQANGIDADLELALFEADHGSNPQAALTLAKSAYERRPGVKGAETLAWALYRTGDYTEARNKIEEALRLGTQDALLFYRAGVIARAQGDSVAAQRWLSQALELNPYFSPVYVSHARTALADVRAAGNEGRLP